MPTQLIRRDQYEKVAMCIQMDQMSAAEIAELFEDKKFHKWYRKEFIEFKRDPGWKPHNYRTRK
tara:strand:- start:358 stop:549 length:192 start_codon:yes stop_codon:yes gene_type:complete